MPRIFHVTFTKEIEATIVADSEEHLIAALENEDPDDWHDSTDWNYNIHDPLKGKSEMIPVRFAPPDMGVLGDSVHDIFTYKLACPDYLEEVEQEAKEIRYKKGVDEVNLKLPNIV